MEDEKIPCRADVILLLNPAIDEINLQDDISVTSPVISLASPVSMIPAKSTVEPVPQGNIKIRNQES